jgi:hypothetical protein
MYMSQTENLLQVVRKTPIFRQLVPHEAATGYPIPLRLNNKVYCILLFYGVGQNRKPGQTLIYPPLATLTLEWKTQLIVEYVNLRFRSPVSIEAPDQAIGKFPHQTIESLTLEQYRNMRQTIFTLYDDLFERLSTGANFDPKWREEFRHLLRLLLEPPLEPFYRALAPKFFDHFLSQEGSMS